MPYRRYYKKRRYTRRKKATSWYNRKYSIAQMASKAIKGVNYIRGLVNSEKFKHDISGSQSIGYNGTVTSLVGITQGDGDGARTGNSIYVRSISMKGSIERNSAGSAIQKVRIMWLIDKQQVGDTVPAASDILDTTGSAIAPLSLLNDTTVGRFTILKSRLYNVTSDKPCVTLNWNMSMRHHVRFNGSTTTDIQKGAIYMLVISDAATNLPTLDRFIRVSYHDN